MKYYYGNSVKEALSSEAVEIETTDALRGYQQNYNVVIPADEIDDEDDRYVDVVLTFEPSGDVKSYTVAEHVADMIIEIMEKE